MPLQQSSKNHPDYGQSIRGRFGMIHAEGFEEDQKTTKHEPVSRSEVHSNENHDPAKGIEEPASRSRFRVVLRRLRPPGKACESQIREFHAGEAIRARHNRISVEKKFWRS